MRSKELWKDEGLIQQRIQRPCRDANAAAGECSVNGTLAGDARFGGGDHAGALARGICGQTHLRTGLDSGGATEGTDYHTAAMDEVQREVWCREQHIFLTGFGQSQERAPAQPVGGTGDSLRYKLGILSSVSDNAA